MFKAHRAFGHATMCCPEFATKTILTKHRRREESAVRYKCDVCGAGLKERLDLQAHMYIDSDENRQNCDKCDRSSLLNYKEK